MTSGHNCPYLTFAWDTENYHILKLQGLMKPETDILWYPNKNALLEREIGCCDNAVLWEKVAI